MFQNLVCNNHPCWIFPRIIKMLYFIFQVRQVLTLIQYEQISHEEISTEVSDFTMIGGVYKLQRIDAPYYGIWAIYR